MPSVTIDQHTTRGILVFLLRAVLLLIELSTIRHKDTNIRLLYHVFELSLVTILYGVVSHVFAYSQSAWKTINNRLWIDAAAANMSEAVSGWAGVITAAVLATSMVAGRFRLLGCIPSAILMAAFLDPIIIHWAWSRKGLSHTYDPRDLLEDMKQPGCATVHALTGILFTLILVYMALRCFYVTKHKLTLSSSSFGDGMLSSVFLVVCTLGLCMPYAFNQMTHEFGKYMGGNVLGRMLIVWAEITRKVTPRYDMDRIEMIDIETGLFQPFGLHVGGIERRFGKSRHVVIWIEGNLHVLDHRIDHRPYRRDSRETIWKSSWGM